MNPYTLLVFMGSFLVELGILYTQVERQVFFKRIFDRAGGVLIKMPLPAKIGSSFASLFIAAGAVCTLLGWPFPGVNVEGSLSEIWVALPFGALFLLFIFIIFFDARIMPKISEPNILMLLVPFWVGLIQNRGPVFWAVAAVPSVVSVVLIVPRWKVRFPGKVFLYLYYLVMMALCSYWFFPVEYLSAMTIDPIGAVLLGSGFVYFGIHWSVLVRFFIISLGLWRKTNREAASQFLARRFSDNQLSPIYLIVSFLIFALMVPAVLFLRSETAEKIITALIIIILQLQFIKKIGGYKK